MSNRFLAILTFLMLLSWGSKSIQAGQASSPTTDVPASKPVITEAFASKELRPGDTWKIYLKASDSSSDMKMIIADIHQPGRGGYPPSYIPIRDKNKRDLSGYIYWNSGLDMQQGLTFTSLTLTVQIKDKAGNLSNMISFPLHFRMTGQQAPPSGVFTDNELGPVMTRILPLVHPD